MFRIFVFYLFKKKKAQLNIYREREKEKSLKADVHIYNNPSLYSPFFLLSLLYFFIALIIL